jgi:hypothetical protein
MDNIRMALGEVVWCDVDWTGLAVMLRLTPINNWFPLKYLNTNHFEKEV